jgi:hypothetical protein
MHEPATVGWLLVALCGAVGAYCLARLCSRVPLRAAERHADAAEGLMASGMVVMAVPGGVGMRIPAGVWAGVFGVALVWVLAVGVSSVLPGRGRARSAHRRAHHLYHAVGMAAMVYVAVAGVGAVPGLGVSDRMAGMDGMAAMPGAAPGMPAVTGCLLLFFAGYALWQGFRLVSMPVAGAARGPGGGSAALFSGERGPDVCRMAMSLSMFAMLLAL